MKRSALVVRIWLDDNGRLQGQVSDPLSDWKRPFRESSDLWTLLHTFLVSPQRLPHTHQFTG
ncbi:MAG: hypothetical protein GY805_01270 [Chloroflexi bacterium]|nr:hypothetical protein [Chloroflexota bacterium]